MKACFACLADHQWRNSNGHSVRGKRRVSPHRREWSPCIWTDQLLWLRKRQTTSVIWWSGERVESIERVGCPFVPEIHTKAAREEYCESAQLVSSRYILRPSRQQRDRESRQSLQHTNGNSIAMWKGTTELSSGFEESSDLKQIVQLADARSSSHLTCWWRDDVGALQLHFRLDVRRQRPLFSPRMNGGDRGMVADLFSDVMKRSVPVAFQLVGFAEQWIEGFRHPFEMGGETGDHEGRDQMQTLDRRGRRSSTVEQRRVLQTFSETLKETKRFYQERERERQVQHRDVLCRSMLYRSRPLEWRSGWGLCRLLVWSQKRWNTTSDRPSVPAVPDELCRDRPSSLSKRSALINGYTFS